MKIRSLAIFVLVISLFFPSIIFALDCKDVTIPLTETMTQEEIKIAVKENYSESCTNIVSNSPNNAGGTSGNTGGGSGGGAVVGGGGGGTVSGGYQSLTNLPITGEIKNSGGTLDSLLKTIYNWGVGIAVALAALMLLVGGIQYMTTAAVSGKEEGRGKMNAAIIGLLLALGSWLILNQINPDILKADLDLPDIPINSDSPNLFPQGDTEGDPNSPGEAVNYVPGDPSKIEGLGEYQQRGRVSVRDNSGYRGTISPEVAWMRDKIPGLFSGLEPTSTYRSEEHNHKIGGSSSSDHLRGEAIDFHKKSDVSDAEFSRQGNQLVDYMLTYGQHLGADQIIFENRNYLWRNNQWIQGSTVGGHNDHVHIGRQ